MYNKSQAILQLKFLKMYHIYFLKEMQNKKELANWALMKSENAPYFDGQLLQTSRSADDNRYFFSRVLKKIFIGLYIVTKAIAYSNNDIAFFKAGFFCR